MSCWVLHFCKDEDSTSPMDKLCQCLTTLTAKKSVFLCSNDISCLICAQCLFPCLWALLTICIPYLHCLPSGASGTHWWHLLSWAFSSPRWTVPALTAFPCGRGVSVILVALHWTLCSMTMPLLYWGALNNALQERLHHHSAKGKDHLSPNAVQSKTGFFCCEGMLNVHAIHPSSS